MLIHKIGPRMARASRMARGNPRWTAILAWLSQLKIRAMMVHAADQQQQPLAAIVHLLHEHFSPDLADRMTKIFVGTAIAGIMDDEGFDVLGTGDRMPPNLAEFRTAARYVRRLPKMAPAGGQDADDDIDILRTMLGALNEAQRHRLGQMIASAPNR